MGLLWFSKKKRAADSLQPPAPAPDQAKDDMSKSIKKPEEKASSLPPMGTTEQEMIKKPEKMSSEVPQMPPAFEIPTVPPQDANPAINPPTAMVGEDIKLDDLPQFEDLPHYNQLKEDLGKITPETHLPAFESNNMKMGEGLSQEQKDKLEEVVRQTPRTLTQSTGNLDAYNSDMITRDMQKHIENEKRIAEELEEIPKHLEDPHKLISYEHNITNNVQIDPQKKSDDVFDNMKGVVESELDKQVSSFRLHDLELEKKKGHEVIPEEKIIPEQKQEPQTRVAPAQKAPTPKQKKQKASKQIIPLEKVKEEELLSKKKYYLQTKPIFVFIDKYKYMLDKLHQSKACLKSMEEVSKNVFEINKNEDMLHEKLIGQFEKVQESLIYIDSTLFETE